MMKVYTCYSNGINWTWYYIIKVDPEAMTARILHSYRAHNYEPRGEHLTTNINVTIVRNSLNIEKWRKDGKPGGMSGLKDNYRCPSTCIIKGEQYKLLN